MITNDFDLWCTTIIARGQNMKTSTDATNVIYKNSVPPQFSILGMQTQGYKNAKRYKFKTVNCL
jgi:hypothetical protein